MNTLDPMAWAIILLLLGCALVVVEVFVPSGGILGFLSAAALFAAVFIAFQRGGLGTGFTFFGITLIAVPLLLTLAFKYFPYTPMGKALLGELPTDEELLPEEPRRVLIGRIGVARSKMLPSGAVEIDGHMIDAITQGQAIEPGEYVEVIEVRANRVVVAPAPEGRRPQHSDPRDFLNRPLEELGIEGLDDSIG